MGLKRNEFLRSHMIAGDFKLTLQVKLVPNAENSGVQFRSEALANGDVKGPQGDVGAGWWGKLYEEHGRGLIWKEGGEQYVKKDDGTAYTSEAGAPRPRPGPTGQLGETRKDKKTPRRGLFAFQPHSGGPMEVRFRDIRLEVLAPPK